MRITNALALPVAVSVAISIGSAVPAQANYSTDATGSPVTLSEASTTIERDASLASEHLSLEGDYYYFDSEGAIAAGVSRDFAESFDKNITYFNANPIEAENAFSEAQEELKSNNMRLSAAPSGSVPMAAAAADQGFIDCLLAGTGWGIAQVSVIAALFASGGVFALAAAGYAVSLISIARSCDG